MSSKLSENAKAAYRRLVEEEGGETGDMHSAYYNGYSAEAKAYRDGLEELERAGIVKRVEETIPKPSSKDYTVTYYKVRG